MNHAVFETDHPDFHFMVALMRFIEDREHAMWLELIWWTAGINHAPDELHELMLHG